MKNLNDIVAFSFRWIKLNAEALCWACALVIIAFISMDGPSLCFFRLLGVGFCPGCGLGHAMQDAMRLNFESSLQHHPLGIFAIVILLYRIYTLIFKKIDRYAKQEFHDLGSGR